MRQRKKNTEYRLIINVSKDEGCHKVDDLIVVNEVLIKYNPL